MKKIIFQMAIIMAIVLVGNYAIKKLCTNFSWGNETNDIKVEYYKKNISNYNTVFIGSSTTYKQIMPTVFDKQTKRSFQIKSFNMGSQAAAPPESYVFFENLISMKSSNLKYVIVELRDIAKIWENNLHSHRITYWYSIDSYIFAVNSILNSLIMENDAKKQEIKYHTVGFLENIFNIGTIKSVIEHQIESEALTMSERKETLGENYDGFVPLEPDNPGLQQRNKQFLKDTTKLYKKGIAMNQLFSDPGTFEKGYNKIHLKKINKMIEYSKKKGIHIIFLLQPKQTPNRYLELLPIYNQIDDQHKIELADSRKYPQLYLAKNSFDNGHLNIEGARKLTSILAYEFNMLIVRSYIKN